MSSHPVIGISLDHEPEGGYASTPWYALRENYCTAVSAHGALPLAIPHEMDLVEHYADHLDALVLTGGGYDIPPTYYGSRRCHDTIKSNPKRTAFEIALAKAMIPTNKPILGICGGKELLSVLFGGTLIQHIPDEIISPIEHRQKPPFNQPCHEITIKEGTLLHRITGKTHAYVNSDHHQSTKDLPEDIVINALAPDGVIEGIEHPDHPFCLGVLWHPEHMASPIDKDIFAAFVNAAK